MILRLHQVAFELAAGVLGALPHRMGVWTQGCSLPKCAGCVSSHTWDATTGTAVPVEALLRLAGRQPIAPNGLTVSGGEPTDQAAAVIALARGFRHAFPEGEIVLYTGLRWPILQKRHLEIVGSFDVVVAGPYVRGLPATPIAGSRNQEVRLLTPLAQSLYRDWQSWPRHAMQVASGIGTEVVAVGIPDVTRLARAARQAGLTSGSWQGPRRAPKKEEQR